MYISVTNNTGKTIFFPYNTAGEATNNPPHSPSGVSVGSCGPGPVGACGPATLVSTPPILADQCSVGTGSPAIGGPPYTWTCTDTGGVANCSTPAASVNGVCSATNLNTCTSGNFVDASDTANTYVWSCNGTGGGSNDLCALNIPMCGTAHESNIHLAPSTLAQQCGQGTMFLLAGPIAPEGWYGWECESGNQTVNCQTKSAGAVNGACNLSAVPACNAGTASLSVENLTTYNWTCFGSGGGSDAPCSVYRPQCGSANGTDPGSAPSAVSGTNVLCMDNSAPTVSGTGPWTWTCTGVTGTQSASCSAGSAAPTGACAGYGYDNTLFAQSSLVENQNGCTTQYRDVYIDINLSTHKAGNIYNITQGQQFNTVVGAVDTTTAVLQRIATKINNQNMTYPTLCSGAGSTVVTNATVVSSTRLKYHINWQHQPGISGARQCEGLDQTTCTGATGCNWVTTGVCTGGTYTTAQGTCGGTYYTAGCQWDGSGTMGSNDGCFYTYGDMSSCSSSPASEGCWWSSSIPQTCSASTSASCSSLGAGCTWTAYPSKENHCGAISSSGTCASNGCTWVP